MRVVWLRILIGLFAAWLVTGCESRVRSLDAAEPSTLPLRPLLSAPAAVRDASRAVVKIGLLGDGSGTGTFVKHGGAAWLLTNYHVLGRANVLRDKGAFVNLAFDYEQGKRARVVTVLLRPHRVSSELDAAVFRVFDVDAATGRATTPFTPPHSLELRPVTADELIDKQLFVVGHPQGRLKKWSEGFGVGSQGNWFSSSNYSLPGNSGSPFLDGDGLVVGEVHRAPVGFRGVVPDSTVGTSGAALHRLLTSRSDGLDLLRSAGDAFPWEEIGERQAAFRLARVPNARITGEGERPILSLLARACDAGLVETRFSSAEAVDQALEPCAAALNWISCGPREPGLEFLKCPDSAEKEAWHDRFRKAALRARQLSRPGVYNWLTYYPAFLERDQEEKARVASANLTEFIRDFSPPLSFELAYYQLLFLPVGAAEAYRGVSLMSFALDYTRRNHYAFHYDWILATHRELYHARRLSAEAFVGVLNRMLGDPQLPMSVRLRIEALAYERGWLAGVTS